MLFFFIDAAIIIPTLNLPKSSFATTAYKTVHSLTIVAMLASIRIGQSHRALAGLSHLVKLLRSVKSNNTPEAQSRLCQEISLQSSKVAVDLTCERHFMQMTAESVQFDPRFLVFEFTYSLMLRKSQVTLVNKFIAALKSNRSMCHQMIMGAGKTTVVAPLLAMILADGKSLVTQVVPHALLDFSRGVMREKFAAGSYDRTKPYHLLISSSKPSLLFQLSASQSLLFRLVGRRPSLATST